MSPSLQAAHLLALNCSDAGLLEVMGKSHCCVDEGSSMPVVGILMGLIGSILINSTCARTPACRSACLLMMRSTATFPLRLSHVPLR